MILTSSLPRQDPIQRRNNTEHFEGDGFSAAFFHAKQLCTHCLTLPAEGAHINSCAHFIHIENGMHICRGGRRRGLRDRSRDNRLFRRLGHLVARTCRGIDGRVCRVVHRRRQDGRAPRQGRLDRGDSGEGRILLRKRRRCRGYGADLCDEARAMVHATREAAAELGGKALAAVALAGKDLRGVGAVNLILVPALAAMILYLAAKSEQTGESLPVAIYPSVSYCAMNMLLGGVLVSKDAEEASAAEICCISAASGCVMAALLAGVYVVSMGYADFAMPLFEFCRDIGAGFVGAAIAITAILTTLVGAAKTLRDGLEKAFGSGVSASCAVAMLALASSKLDFASAVDGFYPLIGAAASAVVIGIIPVFVASMLSVRRPSIHSVNLFRRRR